MFTISSVKWAVIAIAGIVLTVLGWQRVASSGDIFEGYSFAGPTGAVVAAGLFAMPLLGFSRSSGRLRRLFYLLVVLAVALGAGAVNTGLLKVKYPHAPLVDHIEFSDTNH